MKIVIRQRSHNFENKKLSIGLQLVVGVSLLRFKLILSNWIQEKNSEIRLCEIHWLEALMVVQYLKFFVYD